MNSRRAEIAATRKQSHDDMVMLLGIVGEHDKRLTVLESRS
jgi:hypothetical protein